MELFKQKFLLDLLPADVLPPLCLASRELQEFCGTYLQERIRIELKDSKIELNPENPITDFIRLMSIEIEDFVTRGSEKFIGLDEALYRAVKQGDKLLINYFLRMSPEAGKGCGSKHVHLVALASLLEDRYNIVEEIWNACELPWFFRVTSVITSGTGIEELKKDAVNEGGFIHIDEYDSISLLKRVNDYLLLRFGIQGALDSAVEWNHLNTVKYLIGRHHVDLQFSLEVAAAEGYLDIIKCLINTNPNLDLQGALLSAASRGHPDVIKYLIDIDPDLDLQKAFEHAASRGHPEVIKYLIEVDRSLDLQESLNRMQGRVSSNVVSYLLALDSKLIINDINMEDVIRDGFIDVLEYVMRINPEYDPQSALLDAFEYNGSNVAIYLIKKHPNLVSQKILHKAIKWNLLDVVKYLVEKHPELDLVDALLVGKEYEMESITDYLKNVIRNKLKSRSRTRR